MLSKKRDEASANAFFVKAIGSSGLPEKVTIDKSGANNAGLNAINLQLIIFALLGCALMQINIRQIKYLNNIVDQDHRGIKKITNPMMGFKSFYSADATLAGIELYRMLKKGQHINAVNSHAFEQFYALAAQLRPGKVRLQFLTPYESICDRTLFSANIDVMLEETEQQYHYIQYLKNGTYQIEKSLITRIITFYQTQLDKVMYYDEQLQRWLSDASKKSNNRLLNDIFELKKIVGAIKKLSHSIITLTNESDVEEHGNATVLTVNKKMFLNFVDGKFEEKK